MYSVTLLFTLGGTVIVLVRPGVGAGGRCGLVLGLLGITPPLVGRPPLLVAQLVKGLQQVPGLSSFAALLLWVTCPAMRNPIVFLQHCQAQNQI